MAAIDTVYHYYLSTYANSTVSRYDSHKKSELRDIYNRMVKTNKESPLYRLRKQRMPHGLQLTLRRVPGRSRM